MRNFIVFILALISTTLYGQFNPITVTRQAQLNALQYYPVIYEDLIITTEPGQDSSTMITDLSPLLGVDTLYRDFYIHHSALTSLAGLENIQTVGLFYIHDNDLLEDLSTLNGPMYIQDLYIIRNNNLKSISGLTGMKQIESLWVLRNSSLDIIDLNFSGFADTTLFGDHVNTRNIDRNPNLKTVRITSPSNQFFSIKLDSNASLTSFYLGASSDTMNSVFIRDNANLSSFSGFGDVQFISRTYFINNPNLTELCFVQQTLLRDGISTQTYNGNGIGANSEAEVMATDCSNYNTGVNEVEYQELTLYPNPAHSEVFIGVQGKFTQYQIYDMSGKVVQTGNVEANGRIGLSSISGGMYVLLVDDKRSKLVIQ